MARFTIHDLAATIDRLLADRPRRQELGARARVFYEGHMTLSGVTSALDEILANAAPGGAERL